MRLGRWLAVLVLLATAAPAGAADVPGPILVNAPIVTGNPCADPTIQNRIIERFGWAERRQWRRGFEIQSLANARPSGHPYFEPGLIHREFCMADATMTDGSPRTVFFAIEFGQGFASIGNYVNFCVLGLDPWHVYDADCRTVR